MHNVQPAAAARPPNESAAIAKRDIRFLRRTPSFASRYTHRAHATRDTHRTAPPLQQYAAAFGAIRACGYGASDIIRPWRPNVRAGACKHTHTHTPKLYSVHQDTIDGHARCECIRWHSVERVTRPFIRDPCGAVRIHSDPLNIAPLCWGVVAQKVRSTGHSYQGKATSSVFLVDVG